MKQCESFEPPPPPNYRQTFAITNIFRIIRRQFRETKCILVSSRNSRVIMRTFRKIHVITRKFHIVLQIFSYFTPQKMCSYGFLTKISHKTANFRENGNLRVNNAIFRGFPWIFFPFTQRIRDFMSKFRAITRNICICSWKLWVMTRTFQILRERFVITQNIRVFFFAKVTFITRLF